MTTQAKPLVRQSHRILGSRAFLLPGLLFATLLLVVCLLWSIALGAADIAPETVYNAIFASDGSFQHLIIQTIRLPRVLSGIVVGAALAVAGALMQGLTRNPLADSGLLGINSGAAFAVVLAIVLRSNLSLSEYAIFGFVGAGIAAVTVYALGSLGRSGTTPLKLTLAGVILTAFVSSMTTAILIGNREALNQIRFWTAGALSGRDMALLLNTAPYIIVGLIGAMLISRQITTISLGDDVARGLGQNTTRVRVVAAFVVVLLAGGSVALAGPIGFVGLIVPHLVRFLIGVDYRWIVPYSAVLGGLLVTVGDVGARVLIRPQELPVGVVMAALGAPFFIWLARRQAR